MADFKTEITEVKVIGKIETTEIRATIVGYSNPGKQGRSAYQVAVDNDFIGTEEEWLASLIGPIGPNGIPVEIRATDTYIQWKYINDITWTNVIALSALIGPQGIKGNEIQLRTNETHIQWKYDNEEEWTNLIVLSELQGPQGIPGEDGYTPQKGTDYVDGLDITWKGTYDAETQYHINDAIFYNGSSYICILDSVGNLPTNTLYFNIMAQQGQTGAGTGDMLSSMYDPTGKQADVFDYGNFDNTPTFKTINGETITGSGDLEIIGVEDGDKGDVTVTDAGETWTIDNGVVSNSKLSNMIADTIKGRVTDTGSPEDLNASQVRTIINVEDGAQVNNIVELEELPEPSSEYVNNIYKVDNKLYVCKRNTETLVQRTIDIGDNLASGIKLYFSFPDEYFHQPAYNAIEPYKYAVNVSDINYIFFTQVASMGHIGSVKLYKNGIAATTIWEYNENEGGIITNITSLTLGADFGVVTSIEELDPAYEYITADLPAYEWVEYGGSITVIDNLDSASPTNALSANMGRVLNEKNIIQAILNSAQSFTSGDIMKINLAENIKVGSKFSINNGDVVVGQGITKVSIESSVQFDNVESGNQLIIYIYKNSSQYTYNEYFFNGNYASPSVSRILMNVVQGDTISLRCKNTQGNGKVSSGQMRTRLIVEDLTKIE